MIFFDILKLALRNLREAKLRVALTTIGVIVGVTVIVTMVSFGLGLQRNAVQRFKDLDLFNEITVTGQEAHAGPTPMPRRRDALVGAARMIDAVNRIGHAHAPYACATVGFVRVSPNSRNTIPGRVFFTVDFRHPEDAVLTAMDDWSDRRVFVHCAAEFDFTSLAEFDLSVWHDVLAVNVEAALWLAQAFTPGMTERRFGRIVFITSDTFWDPPTRPPNSSTRCARPG